MSCARRLALALLVALAPFGCAHQAGTLTPGGAPRPVDDTRDVTGGRGAPAEGTAAVAAAADAGTAEPGGEDLAAEDDLEAGEAPSVRIADPLAPWNRAMFQFNDKLYFWALKPAARAYKATVPRLARKGVENFFHNLGTPIRLVSDLLQFNIRDAAVELGSFMINTTWGVAGFGNLFAGNPEAKTPDADLGLALARHGVGNGIYLVWPFLGPSTVRDTAGWVGGLFLDPVSYVQPLEASLGVRAYSEVNATSFRIGDYESLKDAAIDPYLAVRDAYLQNRAKKVRE
jgi:phospholipid-binding lipoprotein MlaA